MHNYLQRAFGSYNIIININDSLQLNLVLSVGDGIMLYSLNIQKLTGVIIIVRVDVIHYWTRIV